MLSSRTKGYLFALISGFTFGTNPLFALPLYERGLSTPSVLFYRFSLGAVLLSIYMLILGKSFRISLKQVFHAAIFGGLFALASLFFFQSIRRMDAGLATSVMFVYPAIVALIMFFIFRERLGIVSWIALICSLGGVGLLYEGNGSVTFAGLGFVLLSALVYSLYIIGLKYSPLQKLSSESLTFYQMLLGLPFFLCMTKGGSALQLPHDMIGWGCMFGLALFPAMLSILFMALALRHIGPTKTSILTAIEPLTAIFFGVLIFGETLTLKQCFGVAVILLSVTLVVSGKNLNSSGKKDFSVQQNRNRVN